MKNQISDFLEERIDAKDFPSAVYLVARGGQTIICQALGLAVVEPVEIKATIETIYDLASLTKVLVTGLLAAKLIESGEINLSDKVSKYFSEYSCEENSEITIENLVTHTSGFQAWKPFYLMTDSRSDILTSIFSLPLDHAVNSKVVYSDLNFLVLTFLLEKIFRQRLDRIAAKEIFEPLELVNTYFNPPNHLQHRIAASEDGNKYEKQVCQESGYKIQNLESKIRNRLVWGEVHDGNCWFMDGVSGHAGLFSTAPDTFQIARQFLAEESLLLKPETCSLFRTNLTPGLNEARSVAFQLAETGDSTAGKTLHKDSFGHLGFTGTSLWIEPETSKIFILLTNRTHHHDLPFANINSVRRQFNEMASTI